MAFEDGLGIVVSSGSCFVYFLFCVLLVYLVSYANTFEFGVYSKFLNVIHSIRG